MRFPFRFRPRFTLSGIMILIAVLSAVLAWEVHRREEAKRIRGLMERERYALRVLAQASAHSAIAENERLRSYGIAPSRQSTRHQSAAPGQSTFVIETEFNSHTARRAEWPVEDIKKSMLSSFVKAVTDMKVLTSIDVATVTSDCAVVAGDEGWVVWEFVDVQKRLSTATGSGVHALALKFKCRGNLTYESPLASEPNYYMLGEEPEQAIQSATEENRLAGASHIRIWQDKDNLELVFTAIKRENDSAVLDRLFRAIELQQPPGNLERVLLDRLRQVVEQDEARGPLAARTILRADHLYRTYKLQGEKWSRAALSRLRMAAIKLLKSNDTESWPAAAEELRRQMTPDDQEAVEAMIAAIKSGEVDERTQVQLRQALRGNRHALDPLFSLVADSDEPTVWFRAGECLRASLIVENFREEVWGRILMLRGRPQYRMQVAAGHNSPRYEEELKVLGDDAYEFLVPLIGYDISERLPSLSATATDMLAKLGDPRAIPVLASAVEDQFWHGNLDASHTAYRAAALVKAINELTGENFGNLGHGRGVAGNRVESCDWNEIREGLAKYLQKNH